MPSRIDLDAIIGNIDGNFLWGSGGYSQSAQNISLNGANTLSAQLQKADGRWNNTQQLNLDVCIANINGRLTYQ